MKTAGAIHFETHYAIGQVVVAGLGGTGSVRCATA